LSATTPIALSSGGTAATSAPAAQANLLGYTTTATAAGTTTLDNTSSFYQLFTGATTQTVVLPVTSTLQTGWSFRINNSSTGALTVQSSGLNAVITVNAGSTVMCTCIDTTVTTAAGWRVGVTEVGNSIGTGNMVLSSGPTITGLLNFTGTSTSNANFGTALTTGTITIGGVSGTGLMIFGRATTAQTIQIGNGITATATTKAIDIGINGASGSTTNITIGSATSGSLGTTTLQAPTVNIGQTATQFSVINTASAVNYVQVTGAATSASPQISAQGSDATASLIFITKGALDHRFATNTSATNVQFRVAHTAGTIVNYTAATGNIAGSSPSFAVAGTDTDIDLTLTPKGAGAVRFGTYTGTILTPTGYITIKDSGGTTRRLLVG
jgi:hypothetical protein